MAFLSKKPSSFLVLAFYLFLFSLFQSIHSLSTVAISENSNQTLVCALTQSSSDQHNSHLNCTSFPGGIQVPLSPLNSSISGIVAGNGFICAVRSKPTSSIMGCWRFSPSAEYPEEEWSYKRIYRGLPIDDLSAGDSHICGITSGGLECWQWEEFNSTTPDFRNFTSVAVGEDFVCGLSEFGNIKCNINTVSGYEPSGNYSAIAAGPRHTCAIFVNNGSLQCWGNTAGENPPEGEFTTLALGENRSCAIRPNGTVACWGEKSFGLPESLNSTSFVAIEAKRSVFCGVRASDFSLVCWGSTIFENSFSTVLENVVPGPCRSVCPCRPLPGYGSFCSQGQMICEPCGIKSSTLLSTPPPPPTPTPPPPPQGTTGLGSGGWNEKMVAFLVVGCAGSASLLVVCCFLFFRYCNNRGCRVHDSGPLDMEANTRPQPAAAAPVLEKKLSHLVSMGNGGHLEEFPLHLLLKATNNFWDDHKIGAGSFGSVYHAILDDGREVAIKRAETTVASSQGGATKRQQDDRDNAFVSELESLSHLNHKNLAKLLGYCEESGELILVYEYMRNGTLHDHLHNLEESPLMSWPARIKVALDVARGIEYLHVYAVPQIIHRDIKSSNILLDDTWNAKVSDFGLSLMGPLQGEAHLSLRAAGTVGYMDPEYYRLQQLTPKSDVYSFGVLLLEILSGCKAIHQTEYGMPRNVVDFLAPYIVREEIHRVLDPRVPPPTPFEIEAVAYVGYIAVDCVMPEGRHRPTISEIVTCLERALTACSPPSPQLSRSTTGSITEIVNNLERAQASRSPPSPAGPPPSPQLCRSPTGSSTRSIMEIGNGLERAQASSSPTSSPSSPPPSPQLFRSPTGSST